MKSTESPVAQLIVREWVPPIRWTKPPPLDGVNSVRWRCPAEVDVVGGVLGGVPGGVVTGDETLAAPAGGDGSGSLGSCQARIATSTPRAATTRPATSKLRRLPCGGDPDGSAPAGAVPDTLLSSGRRARDDGD